MFLKVVRELGRLAARPPTWRRQAAGPQTWRRRAAGPLGR